MNEEPKFCVRCVHGRSIITKYKGMKEHSCICYHPRCLDIVTERPRDCREVRQDTCLVQGVYFEPKPEE